MASYSLHVVIDERDDCEPFRTKKDVAKFVEGKLRDGAVVKADVVSVRDKEISHQAIELALYAQNDAGAYRAWILPMLQASKKHYDRGEGDYERVISGFQRVLLRVAKDYVLVHCGMTDSLRSLFPPSVRKEAAEYLADYFLAEYRANGGGW